MSVFRLIEGIISIKRPPKPLGYFSAEGDYTSGTQTFDFGKVRKDIYFETSHAISVKLNDSANQPIALGPGTWRFTDEWADKLIVTFSAPSTHFGIYANG